MFFPKINKDYILKEIDTLNETDVDTYYDTEVYKYHFKIFSKNITFESYSTIFSKKHYSRILYKNKEIDLSKSEIDDIYFKMAEIVE